VESFLQKAGTANSAVPAHQLLGSSTPTSGIGAAAGIGLSAGTLVGQSRQLLAFLQAGEVSTKTKVLSSPSIIATDSIPASITVGTSVPTLTSTGASAVQQAGSSLFTQTISNTSTGIGLTISGARQCERRGDHGDRSERDRAGADYLEHDRLALVFRSETSARR